MPSLPPIEKPGLRPFRRTAVKMEAAVAAMILHAKRSPIDQPRLIPIPAGWFDMGSADGQEVEQPVHRVWVDSFSLAATQVTVAEYARFLHATGSAPTPLLGRCEFLSCATAGGGGFMVCGGRILRMDFDRDGCALPIADRSGVGTSRTRRRRRACLPLGQRPSTSTASLHEPPGSVGRNRWPNRSPTLTGYSRCARTFTSGVTTGSMPVTMRYHPSAILRARAAGVRKSSRGGSWRHHVKISRCAARSSIPPAFAYADYGFRVARGE